MIRGEFVILRPVSAQDGELVRCWQFDRSVVAEWGTPDLFPAIGTTDSEWIGQFASIDQAGCFIVIVATVAVGCVQFRTLDRRHCATDVSICMAGADEQSRIHAADAVAALCTFLFQQHRVHRIELTAREGSRWSQRMREQLGFQTEGILRDNVFIHGTYHDETVLALIASDQA